METKNTAKHNDFVSGRNIEFHSLHLILVCCFIFLYSVAAFVKERLRFSTLNAAKT